jgi:site-specific DNA-methyltransferase (adenine-specific)
MTQVFNRDCMEAMKEFPDKFFELAIVDPPYGIGKDGQTRTTGGNGGRKAHEFKGWDSKIPPQEYFDQLFRVSRNQIIFGGNYFAKHLPSSMGWIVWDKGQRINQSDGELVFTSFDCALRIIEMNRVELLLEGTIHPTQKPVKLYKKLIHDFAKPGDKILDTHLGSGSSRIAADQMGFDFWGYELDKDYFEASVKRFNQYKAQTVLF